MKKSEFALLYAQEAVFWQLCSDSNWPEGLQERYRLFCKKVGEAAQTIPAVLDITITGIHRGEDVSHHDIDDALESAFKSKVTVDSESGQFFAYCNNKNKGEIEAWLTMNYPGLNFTSDENEDPSNPYFCNWHAATTYCKKNGIEVTMPEDAKVDSKKLEEIELLNKEIEELTEKRDDLLKSL